jgi:glycosyltransferase involved in cell wall biosynthesis
VKQPKLRILLTADAVGGVWQYSIDLARALSKLGVEVVLAVLGPPPSEAQLKVASAAKGLTLIDTGLPLDWLADTPASVRSAGKAVARLAESHSVDVIQLNAPALAAEAKFPVPVVAVNHSCLATWWGAVKNVPIEAAYKWRSDLATKGLRKADRVVTPTAAFSEATQKAHDLPALPTTVHNGRTPLVLPRVAIHDFAFTAGRLWDRGKNLATLDRAAAELPVPLYMAGPTHGPNGDAIELEHGRVLGNLSEKEVARWLAAKPVFVSAALYEPFGLAVLEAAAAGCPLVLSDIPTFRELWDGVATFLPATDHMAFAKAVESIIGDAYLRTAMGGAARERASRYTPEAMARQMLGLYRELATAPAEAGKVAA